MKLKNSFLFLFPGTFRFYPVFTVFAVCGVLLCFFLGAWQLHRLEWKLSLIEKIEARVQNAPASLAEVLENVQSGRDMEYTPVYINGTIADRPPVRIFGVYKSRAGYFLFIPFNVTEQRKHVYVNTGFVEQSVSGSALPGFSPGTDMYIEGLFRYAEVPSGFFSRFRVRGQSRDGYWFIRDPRVFGAGGPEVPLPYYIDSFPVDGDRWPEGGTTRLDFPNRHAGYALTWFVLAFSLAVIWFVFSIRPSSGKPDTFSD